MAKETIKKDTVKYTFPLDMINQTETISITLNFVKKKFPRGVECEVPVDYLIVYLQSLESSSDAKNYVKAQKKLEKTNIQ